MPISTLRYIINNVFLPDKVPDSEEADITTKDSDLVMQVLNVATIFKDAHIGAETLQAWVIICRMLKRMHSVRSSGRMTQSSVEAELQEMEVGGKHLLGSCASL